MSKITFSILKCTFPFQLSPFIKPKFPSIPLRFLSKAEKYFILLTDTSYLFQHSRKKMD